MKILFICGSLEQGKDGVGDYTRRFSTELLLIRQKVQILSLFDHQVISYTTEEQEFDGTKVRVNRIPFATKNTQRLTWCKDILNEFQPKWISLQFVPYSFNNKGLPFGLPSFLEKLKGAHKWHIMFHELWLGIDTESSFKHKCIGKLQEFIVEKVVNKIEPSYITTQNKLYQLFLQTHNISADVFPICGNIAQSGTRDIMTEFTQFVLFGTIHPGAPFKDFVDDLIVLANTFSKPIKFIFIGKNGPELPSFTAILDNKKISYEVMGIQSEQEISKVLINSDFGISTTPYYQTEKSGVFAAYREHRLNTICVARNWTPTSGQYGIPHITKYNKKCLNFIPMDFDSFDVSTMAIQFINSIAKI